MYRPTDNYAVVANMTLKGFEGVTGTSREILKRTNEKGWDLSGHMANTMSDLRLSVFGAMTLRAGCRKIDQNGRAATVISLFPIGLGGRRSFGVIWNGNMDIIDIPEYEKAVNDPLKMTPGTSFGAATSIYPRKDAVIFA